MAAFLPAFDTSVRPSLRGLEGYPSQFENIIELFGSNVRTLYTYPVTGKKPSRSVASHYQPQTAIVIESLCKGFNMSELSIEVPFYEDPIELRNSYVILKTPAYKIAVCDRAGTPVYVTRVSNAVLSKNLGDPEFWAKEDNARMIEGSLDRLARFITRYVCGIMTVPVQSQAPSGDKSLPTTNTPERPKSRYEDNVHLLEFLDESLIDTKTSPAIKKILDFARDVMSPAQLYVFCATHMYGAAHKKSIATLASELGCAPKTVNTLIEQGKKALTDRLREQDNKFFEHPVLRVRVYPEIDGGSPTLPVIDQESLDKTQPAAIPLNNLSSTLFNDADHFTYTAFFLLPDSTRMTGGQIATALKLSEQGVRQKLAYCKEKIILAVAADSEIFLPSHPSLTGEDRYHTARKLSSKVHEEKLALETLCAELIYNRALFCLKDNPKLLIPFVRVFLYKAEDKQSLEEMSTELGYSETTLKTYIADARAIVKADLAESHPGLENHPILRKRSFQRPEETLHSKAFITRDQIRTMSNGTLHNMKWASVLLNREPYHLISWCLTLPPREMKDNFNSRADLASIANYPALTKAFSDFKKMATDSDELERRMQEQRCLLTNVLQKYRINGLPVHENS